MFTDIYVNKVNITKVMFNLIVALHTCFLDEELRRGEARRNGDKRPATTGKFN